MKSGLIVRWGDAPNEYARGAAENQVAHTLNFSSA